MKKRLFSLLTVLVFLWLFTSNPLHSTIYGSVSGKVVDEETGEGVKGVLVALRQPGAHTQMTTYTDEKGEFIFPEVIPGECKISFGPPAPYAWPRWGEAEEKVYLEKGKNLYIVKKLKYGGVIEGKVYDIQSRAPLKGVDIYIKGSIEPGIILTDSEGKFRKDKLYPGKYDVRAFKIGYGVKIISDVEVKSKETTFVEVRFDLNDPTRVMGRITCIQNGAPLKDIEVDLINLTKDIWGGATYTDEDGRYMLIGLEPGLYEMCIAGMKKKNGKEEWKDFCKTFTIVKGSPAVVNLSVDCSYDFSFKVYREEEQK